MRKDAKEKTMKKIHKIELILLSLLILSGCNKKNDENALYEANDKTKLSITMVGKSSENPVFLAAWEGAELAAAKLNKKHRNLELSIDWRTPLTESAEAQAERIRNAVDDGTQAIIVSCSDDAFLTSAIDYAVGKNVPVMTFDSDAPNSKRFAYFGPDDEAIGERVIDELAARLDNKGKIAILGGNQGAPNLQRRVEGMRKALLKYPELVLIGEYYHDETAKAAAGKMLEVNAQNPDLAGWAMSGGWPFFGEELLDKLEPGKQVIVAVDALPQQLPYIEKGIVQVFLGQPTFQWGEKSVESVVNKLYLEKDVPESTQMNLIAVSKANLGGWSRQLRAWGFSNIPVKYLKM
jgi:ribose transport system substrate-binding protein